MISCPPSSGLCIWRTNIVSLVDNHSSKGAPGAPSWPRESVLHVPFHVRSTICQQTFWRQLISHYFFGPLQHFRPRQMFLNKRMDSLCQKKKKVTSLTLTLGNCFCTALLMTPTLLRKAHFFQTILEPLYPKRWLKTSLPEWDLECSAIDFSAPPPRLGSSLH